MFFSVGRNKYKAYDTENISELIKKKIVPQKNWKCIFSFLCLVLISKFSGVGSKHWRGEGGYTYQ